MLPRGLFLPFELFNSCFCVRKEEGEGTDFQITPLDWGQFMVPWAQAVPPGGGSTALLLFLAAALQRGKSRFFFFCSYLVPVAEILSGKSLKLERAAALKDAYCK